MFCCSITFPSVTSTQAQPFRNMKFSPLLLALCAALGGCASSKAPALPMPSVSAPRVAINKPLPIPKSAPAHRELSVQGNRGAPETLHWDVRKDDETIEKMLRRWAQQSGWTVVWKDVPPLSITGDAQLVRPGFLQAADYVMSQARAAGCRCKATAFNDQTLVIEGE